ncbi:MAG: apolipoprotein N-acyltransferase [Bdellovibrionota bacterium]
MPSWQTLLSALLIVLAFPPWNISFLIWFCLVPWLFKLSKTKNLKDALHQGLWLGFFMSLGGFYWVAHTLHSFAMVPWPIAILGFLIFSVFCQPQFAAFAPLLRWLEFRRPEKNLLLYFALIALIYSGIDWFLPKMFMDTFGHAFHRSPWLRQAADLGGAWLLTCIVFFVNMILFEVLRNPKLKNKNIRLLSSTTLVILVLNIYGYFRSHAIEQLLDHPQKQFQAAVLQGNIGDFDKLASERGVRGAAAKVLEVFFSLSDEALSKTPKPDVLLWPETSYPTTFRNPYTADDLARDQQLETFVKARKIPLLFGGYDRHQKKDYNAFFFLAPEGELGLADAGDLQIYRKNILLLFGEYIPFAEDIRALKDAFPQVGNFGRGIGPSVLEIRSTNPAVGIVPTNPVICYEALFPNYVIDGVNKGSRLILNITNDSWFGPWGEPKLHLALSVFRSIETRTPQLRGTNTGISALILPDGSIRAQTKIGTKEIMNVTVPVLEPVPTLMKKWGDWFGITALITGLLGLSMLLRKKRKTPLPCQTGHSSIL